MAAGSLVGVVGNRSALAAAEEREHEAQYLFVQNARGVSLKSGVLRLKDVAADTLYFTDRPDRIVGRMTTKGYIESWATGDHSFAEDPPNAVLAVHHEPLPQDIVVVLRNPRLEGADLVYDAEVLDGEEEVDGTEASLFIDEIGRPLTPISFAGANRRERRRDRRQDRREDRREDRVERRVDRRL
jgi:hypothetical protein